MGERFFKDNAEQLVTTLAADLLGDADPDSTVINLMLPEGVILVDGNSDGSDADEEDEHRKPVLVDDEAADSTKGLGGYHGSVPHHGGGAGFIYYAVGSTPRATTEYPPSTSLGRTWSPPSTTSWWRRGPIRTSRT